MALNHITPRTEILRAAQKDEFVISKLNNQLNDVVQSIFGVQKWLSWRDAIHSVVELLYFAHTTLSGGQTLGEEYVYIVQVEPTRLVVPSFKRRCAMVLLHVFGPRLIEMMVRKLEVLLPETAMWQTLDPAVRERLSTWLPRLRQLVMLLHRIHLTIFYLQGSFYHAAKRIAGVRYVLLRRWLGDLQSKPVFNVLAVLSVVQLILSVLNMSKTTSTKSSMVEEASGAQTASRETCSLCWGNRRNTTATPCGHLFCWECITQWIVSKSECPLCRERFGTSRIIPLQNYDPPQI